MKLDATLGNNCRSVAMSTILSHYGYSLSEAMCFGLGEGFDFLGSKVKFGLLNKFTCYAGNNENDIYTLVNALKLEIDIIQLEENDKVRDTIEKLIYSKIPIIARVSLDKYLKFIPSSLTSNKESTKSIFKLINGSAGNHVVVITNCGNTGVLVYEPNISSPISIPWKNFLEAMNPSNAVIYHPSNTLFVLSANPSSIKEDNISDMKMVIWNAIYSNMKRYIKNKSNWGGLHLVEELSENFLYLIFGRRTRKNVEFFRFFGDVATGGGFYRRLYGRFLKEANSKYLKNNSIDLISKEYYKLSRKWSNFSREISKKNCDYEVIDRLVQDIVMLEKKLSLELYHLSKENICGQQ